MKTNQRRIHILDIILILLIILGLSSFVYMIQIKFEYQWDWAPIPQYFFFQDPETGSWKLNILMQGLVNTIKMSVWATIIAILTGIIFGLTRISNRLFRWLVGTTYISLIRNTPPLVTILIFYYFIGDQIMTAIGFTEFIESQPDTVIQVLSFIAAEPEQLSSFIAAVLTLGLYEGAYMAEIIRAGIEAVDKGQWESSAALGMTRMQQLKYIIFPQSFQLILPPMGGQFISTIKDSAIVSVVAIPELTFQGLELIAATYLTFEVWITITIMYFILTFSCSLLFKLLENKIQKNQSNT